MRLARIYQPQPLRTGDVIGLSKAAAHHLIRVLRLSVGREFILFNGEGGEFSAKIISCKKASVSIQVGEYNEVNRESPLQIILGQAVIRSEKMDYTLQKAVELGVSHLIPLLSERSSPKLSVERWEKRLRHWQAIIVAACEQSGRTRIPSISRPILFELAINEIKADIHVILMPDAGKTIQQLMVSTTRIAALVGPEGGWSETESKIAIAAGYVPIQLGPRILRTETAGVVAMALFQREFGDISGFSLG
ncbi:MAG: 16S rRNA (uracil(1498)-N(3))-methyltransferase [Pseudomonadota bacterium]